jgi:hypothetical protein
MFNDYTAQPHHLLWPVMFFTGGTLAWLRFDEAAWGWLGLALYGIGILATLWIVFAGVLDARSEFNISMVSMAKAISELSPDQWQALGIAFPHLRVRWHGKPIEYIDDTDVRLDAFEIFMRDSNEYETAPQRNYGDDTLLRRQWHLWIAYLKANDHIIADSASGNHSYLWRGGAFQHLRKFLKMPVLVDLNELEVEQA